MKSAEFNWSILKFPNAEVELKVKITWRIRFEWSLTIPETFVDDDQYGRSNAQTPTFTIAGGQWNFGIDTNRRSNRLVSSSPHSTSFLSLELRARHSADFPGSIGLPYFWLQSSAKNHQRQLIHVKIAFMYLFIFLFVFFLLAVDRQTDIFIWHLKKSDIRGRRMTVRSSSHPPPRTNLFRTHFSLRNWWMFLTKDILLCEYG